MKEGDPRAADVLAALRDRIGKATSSYQLNYLAQAYAAVVTNLKDDDPRAADMLAALRDATDKTRDRSQLLGAGQRGGRSQA